MTYRAAYLYDDASNGVGVVLTLPEHATLSSEALLALARGELEKVGLPDSYDSIDEAMADVVIGDWTE